MRRLLSQDRFIEILVFSGAFFNAFLAFINMNVASLNKGVVILCEIVIILMASSVIFQNYSRIMRPWMYYITAYCILFLCLALLTDYPNVKMFRDMLLIVTFGLLGICYKGDMVRVILMAAVLLMGFTLLEGFGTDLYLTLFNPAKYYFHTRGVGALEDIMGAGASIFKNATGFQGRISFSLFDTHRLSSLFLEQTSLATFNVFLALFVSVYWKDLSKTHRIFFLTCIFLWVGFVNSRFALGMIGLIFIGHFLYIIVPRYMNILYMPLVLIVCFFLFYDPHIVQMSDTVKGRIGWTMHIVSEITLPALLGLEIQSAPHTMDSGYSTLFYGHSIFGVCLFWLFSSFILPQNTLKSKRYAHHLSMVIALSLLSGAVIFSIKATAFIWFVVGNLKRKSLECKKSNYN